MPEYVIMMVSGSKKKNFMSGFEFIDAAIEMARFYNWHINESGIDWKLEVFRSQKAIEEYF